MRTVSFIRVIDLSSSADWVFKQLHLWEIISSHQVPFTIGSIHSVNVTAIWAGWPNTLSVPAKSGSHCRKLLAAEGRRIHLWRIVSIVKQYLVRCVVYHDWVTVSSEIYGQYPWRRALAFAYFSPCFCIIQDHIWVGWAVADSDYITAWRVFNNW